MRSIVSSLGLGELKSGKESAPDRLARRANRRRQLLTMIALSYSLDAFVLLIYAAAGATSFITSPLYLTCALLSISCFVILSDTHFNDRFKDHYLIVQQMIVSFVLMLAFIYIAPEVACVFLCSLFVVVAFGSLRSTLTEILGAWAVLTAGLAVLFLATNIPIRMPVATPLERFATFFMFAITLGRCMVVGMFSSALRESLYHQGLALKEAYQRIEELADLDELTGAYNRRSIMQALNEEMEQANRNKTALSIALIDLDWFKKINDDFGHPVGDEALRTFAITMFANIRAIDKFGRYGGEEFLLILPETSNAVAVRLLNRLRLIVADLDWASIANGVAVTMSAGVATLSNGETADGLLTRADIALYRAKENGRHKVEAA